MRSESGISSCAAADDEGFLEFRSAGKVMKMNPTAHSTSPTAMIGTDHKRIRRLPTRSIKTRAVQVMMKFVTATESEVRVGLEKPSRVKMVAEKYINEF